jgi:hypothetical protein
VSLGSRTPRYQVKTVSLRQAPVQAPLATPTGIAGAEQAKQRVLGLASSTLVAFQRQNLIAEQATDDLYFTSANSNVKTNVSRIYDENPNPEIANQKATAYIETLQAQAPERYKDRLGVMGSAINNQQLVKSRETFSKNLQLDQQKANESHHEQIVESLKNIDVSTPEGQQLAAIYFGELDDSRERRLQSEVLRKGYQTPEQVALLDRKYAVERAAEIESIQVSQLTTYAIAQDDMIGFMAAVQTGTTGDKTFDDLPDDVKLKAAERVKQAFNTQLQAENYAEKQQEQQRIEQQLATGEQLISIDLDDPAFNEVAAELVSTGKTFQERKQLREFTQNLQNKTAETNPLLKRELALRIYQGDGQVVKEEILRGEYPAGLSSSDLTYVMNTIKQQENEFFQSPAMNSIKERMYAIVGGKPLDVFAAFAAASTGQSTEREANADELIATQMEAMADAYERGEIKTTLELKQYAEQNVYPALREAMEGPEAATYKTKAELTEAFENGGISREQYKTMLKELNSGER